MSILAGSMSLTPRLKQAFEHAQRDAERRSSGSPFGSGEAERGAEWLRPWRGWQGHGPRAPDHDHPAVSVQLNHTIVWCRDKQASAPFLAEILGLPAPTPFGPFLVVESANGVSLDYHDTDGEIAPQHYAFLVGESDFDEVFGRIREQGLEHWADPGQSQPGMINRNDGGRGLYFEDPDGHLLEIITRPYGSAD